MKTNLDKIKDVAISFLYLEPKYKDIKFPMFIAHPFFDSCFLMDYKTNSMYNIFEQTKIFEENRKFIKNIIQKECSVQIIFQMICKPYRLTFFKYIQEYLSDKDFAELLMSSWVETEFITDNPNVKMKEFISWFEKANKIYLMDKDSFEQYNKLPEKFSIYRGVGNRRYKNGMSWTLNKDKAIWFSERFKYDDKHVYYGIVEKQDVLAYTNERNEYEIIVNPKKVKNIGEI